MIMESTRAYQSLAQSSSSSQQQHSSTGEQQSFTRRISDGSIAFYSQSLTFTLNKLKRIFTQQQYHQGKVSVDSSISNSTNAQVAAYECLAELSKVMRVLLEKKNGKSALGRSKELILNSQALIDAVKSYNYETYSPERNSAVLEAIKKLYSSFHVSVSNYVMEDADELSSAMPPALSSSSSSGLATQTTNQHIYQNLGQSQQTQLHQQAHHKLSVPLMSSSKSSSTSSSKADSITMTADGHIVGSSQPQHRRSTVEAPTSLEMQPEDRLLRHPEGMNIALDQAKMWAKYAKDLVAYLEKRTAIEMEYNRSVMKNANTLKTSIGEENYLPFQDVYLKFSNYEAENGYLSVNNFELLSANFIVSLNEHRLEFEKKIKKIKEIWAREKKAMAECQNNFNKCRDLYTGKQSELVKLQTAVKTSEQQSANNGDWNSPASNTNAEKLEKKRRSLEEAKQREKEAYDNVTKSMMAATSCRVHLDKAQRELILKLKDLLSMLEMKIKEVSSHYFETLKDSMTYSPAQMDKIIEETGRYEFGRSYREHANSLPVVEYSSNKGGDFESSESDTNSPLGEHGQQLLHHHQQQQAQLQQLQQYQLQLQKHHQQQQLQLHHQSLQKQQQNSVKLRYDENFEHEINAITKEFKSCIDSMTTTTTSSNSTSNEKHVFGLQRSKRQRLFGVPLTTLTSGRASVPPIVRQCVEEIELSGAAVNGIYRVSGVKSKVESLCSTFESAAASGGGEEALVDLSSLSPNIVANVLKHFFRELPEPLMTFHLYGDFITLAKKYSSSAGASPGSSSGGEVGGVGTRLHEPPEAEEIVAAFKRLVGRMAPAHYYTLRYLMRHLRRIARNSAVNNMPASNLGIIFGQTLLRRNNDPNATSSALFDAAHQGRVVELMIMYANEIFSMTDDDDDEGEEEEEEDEVEGGRDGDDEEEKFNATIEMRRSAVATSSHPKHSSASFEGMMAAKEKSSTLSATTFSKLQSGGGSGSPNPGANSQNYRLLKSATCSSIGMPTFSALTSQSPNSQQQQQQITSSPANNNASKANIVEARRQFFTAGAFHGHPSLGGLGGQVGKFGTGSRLPFLSTGPSSILGSSGNHNYHHQYQQSQQGQGSQKQYHNYSVNNYHQYHQTSASTSLSMMGSSGGGGGGGTLATDDHTAALSPFSQLAATSGAGSPYKIKKLTSANYQQAAQQAAAEKQQQLSSGGKIYPRNSELSKSSSSIYSMTNKGPGLSMITSNEDVV